MKGHCDRHLGRFLEGDLPLDWLHNVGYGVCGVCNRILSSRFRGRCPSCWPAFVESNLQPCSGRPISDDFPPLDQVLFLGSPTVICLCWGQGSLESLPQCRPRGSHCPSGHSGLAGSSDSPVFGSPFIFKGWDQSHAKIHQLDQEALSGLAERGAS